MDNMQVSISLLFLCLFMPPLSSLSLYSSVLLSDKSVPCRILLHFLFSNATYLTWTVWLNMPLESISRHRQCVENEGEKFSHQRKTQELVWILDIISHNVTLINNRNRTMATDEMCAESGWETDESIIHVRIEGWHSDEKREKNEGWRRL